MSTTRQFFSAKAARSWLLGAVAGGLVVAASPVLAQQVAGAAASSPAMIGEVVVTVQKRVQNPLEAPLALS